MSAEKLYDRAGVAAYLRVSRMTLSRWDKVVSLPRDYMGCRLKPMTPVEVKTWYKKLLAKHPVKQSEIGWRREKKGA